MDSFGLSKVVNEKTVRAFAMLWREHPRAALGTVIEPQDYAEFPGDLDNPPSRKRNAWSYIDARDLRSLTCAFRTMVLGFRWSMR